MEARSEQPAVLLGAERAVLEAFLDDMRYLIGCSTRGVSDTEARRRLVPSATTLLGVVQHAAAVERYFFQRVLAGYAASEIAGRSDATDLSWDVDPAVKIDDVMEDFRQACQESRTTAAEFGLDHVTSNNPKRGPMTLRWIYLHMVQELARHAGHADILREQIEAARRH